MEDAIKTISESLKYELGLYIHVPFCERKCAYCGFLSTDKKLSFDKREFCEAVVRELEIAAASLDDEFKIDTVFLGGGTPSLLDHGDLEVLSRIKEQLTFSTDLEFTMEANPNSLQEQLIPEYRNFGITRISMGVQSFDDSVLRTLGRLHTAQQAIGKYKLLRECGLYDLSIDLMFGAPGQTLEQWQEDVKKAIELQPDHISFYGLQLERGTPFYEEYRLDRMDLPDEDTERAMYHHAVDEFKKAGYEHYEISNCARPGKKCRHNMKYWHMDDFIGIGPGASSYIYPVRFKNTDDIEKWYNLVNEGNSPCDFDTYHTETPEESMGIFCFTALRTAEGIELAEFRDMFDMDFFQAYPDKAEMIVSLCRKGLMRMSDSRITLTEKGIDVSNDIMCEFV